ncbi:MAG: class I mannose-6-phosphate isomerase, partial [Clostridia bacterium]|nr:class I mannose-6-phosphate isomerase [Clostridia bacterium]
TEMWYVIDCAPSAKLIYGLQKTVTQEELEQVIREDRITEICHEVPVKKGDVFYIPSGTIHAIGEGILIAEIQQNSNITYRVSDYGRLGADGKPRMLHREKALQVITREPAPALDSEPGGIQAVSGCRERVLADCRYFSVKSLELDGRTERCVKDSFVSLLVLEGVCDFFWNGGNMELQKGDSLFIPAGLPFALDGKGQLLLSQV